MPSFSTTPLRAHFPVLPSHYGSINQTNNPSAEAEEAEGQIGGPDDGSSHFTVGTSSAPVVTEGEVEESQSVVEGQEPESNQAAVEEPRLRALDQFIRSIVSSASIGLGSIFSLLLIPFLVGEGNELSTSDSYGYLSLAVFVINLSCVLWVTGTRQSWQRDVAYYTQAMMMASLVIARAFLKDSLGGIVVFAAFIMAPLFMLIPGLHFMRSVESQFTVSLRTAAHIFTVIHLVSSAVFAGIVDIDNSENMTAPIISVATIAAISLLIRELLPFLNIPRTRVEVENAV